MDLFATSVKHRWMEKVFTRSLVEMEIGSYVYLVV